MIYLQLLITLIDQMVFKQNWNLFKWSFLPMMLITGCISLSFTNIHQNQTSPVEKYGNDYDYILIGAGIGNMQAAAILAEHKQKFVVLEANDYLGGRVKSFPLQSVEQIKNTEWFKQKRDQLKGIVIEKGATSVKNQHKLLLKLCHDFGIQMKVDSKLGQNAFLFRNKRILENSLLQSKKYGKELLTTYYRLKKFGKQYEKIQEKIQERITEGKRSKKQFINIISKYSHTTAQSFFDKMNLSPLIKSIFINILEIQNCVEMKDIDVDTISDSLGSLNDLDYLEEEIGLYHKDFISPVKGGISGIVKEFEKIAVKDAGGFEKVFKLKHAVVEIDNSDYKNDKIVVYAKHQGKIVSFKGKKIIMNVPNESAKNIKISNLSKGKRFIYEEQVKAENIKSFIISKKPFKKPEQSGRISFGPGYLANLVLDESPADQRVGILMFFQTKSKIQRWKTLNKEQKKEQLISYIIKAYNLNASDPEIKDLVDTSVHVQTTFNDNQHINGAYAFQMKIGSAQKLVKMGYGYEIFQQDENGLFFVGSEQAECFTFWIEGAVRSARKKIYELLGKRDRYHEITDKCDQDKVKMIFGSDPKEKVPLHHVKDAQKTLQFEKMMEKDFSKIEEEDVSEESDSDESED